MHQRTYGNMKSELYNPRISGEVRYAYNGEYSYFFPNDLPFDIDVDKGLLSKMDKALISIARLDGKVSQIPLEERDMLLRPFTLMESAESTAIEGTNTTVEDIYKSERVNEKDPEKSEDNKEVLNYRDALNYAISNVGANITEELLLETHKILISGVRGENKKPGQFRSVPVLVGKYGDTLETARYVPPLPEDVPWKFINLLDYINSNQDRPLLCAALSHYQFETIHPFTDGNGRLGRLLIMLILKVKGVIQFPVLYLSGYFNENRRTYIDSLNAIREEDDFDTWLHLFLDAIIIQSDNASKLIDILQEYRTSILSGEDNINMIHLKNSLFVNPFVRISDVETICGVNQTTARRMVMKLMDRGLLEETTGFKRNQLFVCRPIMDIINSYGR